MEGKQPEKTILVLAPQPFFQNRGTPIAVKLLVEELARLGHRVHLLVFHEGDDVVIDGVQVHRIPKLWGVRNIPPSISWKKIVCDVAMFFSMLSLHRRYKFDLIHAVEEAVFLAMPVKMIFGTPYIYDMDSSLAIQVVDKLTFLAPVSGVLEFFEKRAVRASIGIVAVCKALEDIARSYAPEKEIVRLEDISLLDNCTSSGEQLRERYNLSGPIMLYVGNLEGYQGIDLLLEGFQLALAQGAEGTVVIIGGTDATIDTYKKKADELGIGRNTCFCGPKPVEHLGHYLEQADILLSPRVQGNNTPMKLYSYMDSGKVVLATNLPTHTQVLTGEFSYLVEPDRESMAGGIKKLLVDPDLRRELGEKARAVARENYSLDSFRSKLASFYTKIFATPS